MVFFTDRVDPFTPLFVCAVQVVVVDDLSNSVEESLNRVRELTKCPEDQLIFRQVKESVPVEVHETEAMAPLVGRAFVTRTPCGLLQNPRPQQQSLGG